MKMDLKQAMLIMAVVIPFITTAEAGPLTNKGAVKIAVGGNAGLITTLQFDPLTNRFATLSSTAPGATGDKPSFLTFSPNGRFAYAVNEVAEFGGRNQTGSVSSFSLSEDGSLEKISTAVTGAAPVSLMVSPDGKNLIVADYNVGGWSRHSVNEDGSFSSAEPVQTMRYNGSGPNPDRQMHSFLHQALYDPTGHYAFFVDLGGDSVYIHKVDQATGAMSSEAEHVIQVSPGGGPRHITMVQTARGKYDVYVLCALSNQIVNIRLEEKGGTLVSTTRQELNTLPSEFVNAQGFSAGEIMVTRDGRFVYVTNRQMMHLNHPATENSFARFARNKDGTLDHAPAIIPISVGGMTPRHFSFSNDPEQSLVVVGCQQSDKLLVYQRTPADGSLKLLSSTTMKSPTVQLFLPEIK